MSSKKNPIVFVTKNFDKKLEGKSDIVLSPEFYWAKRVTLNVRFSYEVKKMAPSIFDGVLPGDNFEYKVFKLATHEFVVVAYNIGNIITELKALGIDISLVDKIYTAQSEFIGSEIALKVDEVHAIASNEDIVVYLPLKFLDEAPQLNIVDILQEKKLTSDYIYSKSLQNISINNKDSNLILWLFALVLLILFVNVLKIEKYRNRIQKQKETMIKKYDLPKTNFELKSIQGELSKVEEQQSKLKNAMRHISKFKFSKQEFLNSMQYAKSELKLSVKLSSKKREAEFKSYLSKELKIISTTKSNAIYFLVVKL